MKKLLFALIFYGFEFLSTDLNLLRVRYNFLVFKSLGM